MNNIERDFDKLFNPRSVAVVGASNTLGKWGFNMPMNMIGGGYRGEIHMVNPREERVLGFPAYSSLADIDAEVDLLVVAIPARGVTEVLAEAAAKGIRNAVVVSSNFGEVGEEGMRLERHLAEVASQAGITIVGPNTMGIYSKTSNLCCLGAPVFPLKGGVGFISQSGNLGVQLMTWGYRKGVGFSRFVGSGNAANTDISDWLEYLGDDPETDTVILYIEGIKDGRRFLEVARRITPHKPVIALKAGKGRQGERAVLSHSGSLAGPFELFRGAMEQAGIVEAETTEELVDLAAAFSSLPVPRGARVGVMTLGGGWGVAAADSFDREGLELAVLPDEVIAELDGFLPSFWSRRNPVDIVGNVQRRNHYRVLDLLATCDEVDMLITMGTLLGRDFWLENLFKTAVRPFLGMLLHRTSMLPFFQLSLWKGFRDSLTRRGGEHNPEGSGGINPTEALKWTDSALVRRLKQLMEQERKPIIAVAVNEGESSASFRMRNSGVFTATTPERAVRVAGKLARYSRFISERRSEDTATLPPASGPSFPR
ncbi:MAG: CoA-binding protein [Actinomycetota bacterium]|nr:CoA-binding protein [Actinomycetota bacterium]MDD5665758.1 CoA-binding protein [Actinomycetota bacterium]